MCKIFTNFTNKYTYTKDKSIIPMKKFRDLIISGGTESEKKKLLGEISKNLPKNWKLRKDLIKEYTESTSKESDEVICIESPKINKRVGLIWFGLSDDGITVFNIVPKQIGELRYDQYNSILESFLEECVSSNKLSPKFKVDITDNEFSIEDIAGKRTAELLKKWEICCNKSTGNSHPMDFTRWAEFLIEAHKSKSELTSETLIRWLTEVKGWDENGDIVFDLAKDYEYGMELLNVYDRLK